MLTNWNSIKTALSTKPYLIRVKYISLLLPDEGSARERVSPKNITFWWKSQFKVFISELLFSLKSYLVTLSSTQLQIQRLPRQVPRQDSIALKCFQSWSINAWCPLKGHTCLIIFLAQPFWRLLLEGVLPDIQKQVQSQRETLD